MKIVFWSFHVGAAVMIVLAVLLVCRDYAHGEVVREPCEISRNVACSIARYECNRRSATYGNLSMRQNESDADYRFTASIDGQPCELFIRKHGGAVRWVR